MAGRDVTASSPRAVVIVPFRDAARHLPGLLDALSRLDGVTTGDWELVAVDNGSTDGGGGLVRAAIDRGAVAGRVLHRGDVASSYAARNHGVMASSAPVLAFTDADCRPRPSWLSAILDHLEGPDGAGDVVAGAVDVEVADATNVWELFDEAVHLDNEAMATAGRVATANMAVRREVLEVVGPFAEVTSGADHEWSRRARDAGFRVAFVPTARVGHPTRRTRREVVAKVVRTSRGQGELAAAEPGRRLILTASALARPLLLSRHVRVARTPVARGGWGLRTRLFGVSLAMRIRQVPAFVAGWRAAPPRG